MNDNETNDTPEEAALRAFLGWSKTDPINLSQHLQLPAMHSAINAYKHALTEEVLAGPVVGEDALPDYDLADGDRVDGEYTIVGYNSMETTETGDYGVLLLDTNDGRRVRLLFPGYVEDGADDLLEDLADGLLWLNETLLDQAYDADMAPENIADPLSFEGPSLPEKGDGTLGLVLLMVAVGLLAIGYLVFGHG